jgi:Ala-tRNA(Pro) deacylase
MAMECKERLESYLREHKVPFTVVKHAEAFTAQEVAAAQHVSGHHVAKVVMVWADRSLTMLVLPASGRVNLRRATELLGAKKLRLASEAEFVERFPDCQVGAMPPFGNLYDLPVWVDGALADQERIVFRVGTYTETMSLRYSDFAQLVQPKVGELIYEM